MSVPALSVRRPVATLMATIAVAVFGYLAAVRLPVDLLPDLSYPTLTIQTVYSDAAPVSVEQFVTRPVEEAVGVTAGVREMRSISRPGLSEVILEFEWERQMDFAALDVREKLGMVQLPRQAETPRVLRYDPSLDPILRLALTGDRPLGELRQLADRWLKPRLEAITGVAAVKVRGGLDPEIQVEADEDRLAAYGLTLGDLATALQSDNVNQPGGTLKDFNAVYLVRTLHEFDDLEQLRRTVVREVSGRRVRVEDVATVSRGHKDRVEITRAGGSEVVELALHREGSANTVAVSEAVRDTLGRIRGELASDLSLQLLTDQSRYISEAVGQVRSAALIGGLLAILVIFFFLRDLGSTAIIALSIPVSVLATFLPMLKVGVTLNIMSLGGLALGVGMLVDNSIVVLEAIARRRGQGHSRRDAAVIGAGEVSGAVTASTLTTVSVFFPIVFVQGVAGQLFFDQAVTVCFSLLASLLVSLTLIPALAALDLRAAVQGSAMRTLFVWDQPSEAGVVTASVPARLVAFLAWGVGGRHALWVRILSGVLLLPRLVVLPFLLVFGILQFFADLAAPLLGRVRFGGIALPYLGNPAHPTSRLINFLLFLIPVRPLLFAIALLLAGTYALFSWLFQVVFWPLTKLFDGLGKAYPGTLSAALRLRWGVIVLAFGIFALSLAAVPRLGTSLVPDLSQGEFAFRLRLPEGSHLETTALMVERIEAPLLKDPRFDRVFSLVGSLPSSASGRRTQGENLAQINFVLPEGADADAEAAAVDRVRQVISSFSNVDAELVHPSVLVVRSPIAIRVFAEELDVLDAGAAGVAAVLARMPGVTDIATSSEPGNPEVLVKLDQERAGALGVSAALLGESLRRQIRGDLVGTFREGEERLEIRLRASESSRNRASGIEALRVRLPGGGVVPISTVARVETGRGPAAIHRSKGARVAEVTAGVRGARLGDTLQRVRDKIAGLVLPAGARAEMAGQDEELRVSFHSLQLALALAIFLVYVVMAGQFESLLYPFVILISVPLGIIGVVSALLVTGNPISVLALIGSVMLAGIVVNNAIVLVDAINRRRREGEALDQAIVGAGGERLRPILMTTITTVLALLPMALGLGAGDELRAPLAITVIGGLTVATMLTLLVIPCLYRAFSRPTPETRTTMTPVAAPETAEESP